MSESAYRTTDVVVLDAYRDWVSDTEDMMIQREALSAEVGRNIWVNRGNGLGSTRIVGFERFDSDNDGDLVHHEGCLIVSSKRGMHNGLVVPNLRRKSGKAFEQELRGYTTPGLDLAEMPTFHVYSTDIGMVMGGPTVTVWGGVMYAYWGTSDVPNVGAQWEKIPMSVYHAAKEQYA